ncbi:ABC transporter substrate-binding protein [Devosia sp. YIM 151766]|uniref:ABC transporter substrate-binding protein n=1 Tax=Devosia sp. YIM 151766 TaxID=3017325 RepID=UPI00255C43A7|nr:ABC transporter substrate-binding protein [Devosia sp. YIM 151766]WIY52525.1 ABC transporter substrate-binding protein [Devosia sp. YIM 151766]
MRRRAFIGLVAASIAVPVLGQDGGAFPVTIPHALGETVIAAAPERILTIGWMTQDVVLALGQVPVAIPYQGWGGDENGVLPWVNDAVAALGGALPARINFDSGLPIEEIAGLEPDLILAPYSDLDQSQYEILSAIAPTLAYAEGPWSGTWQDITLVVGAALGQPDAAAALVAGVGEQLAAIAAEHPEFAGKSFTFGYYEPNSGNVGIYVATDPRVQMLTDLGLEMSPGSAALPINSGFYVDTSLELLDSMDADVFITWHSSQEELDAFRTNPLVDLFPPVREGRHVGLVDNSFVMATSAPSVLSIPWSIDRLVPELSAVLGR